MSTIIVVIRGSPASGKSTLARGLVQKLTGKKALLSLDEFKWVMTAHELRDEKDFELAFNNYLHILDSYIDHGDYTIITEDCWVRIHADQSTDIQAVLDRGKRADVNIQRILLRGSWDTVRSWNTQRPMVIPEEILREQYDAVYSKISKDEVVIDVDDKSPSQILAEIITGISLVDRKLNN